jgi:hypothetical protein
LCAPTAFRLALLDQNHAPLYFVHPCHSQLVNFK